MRSLKLTLFTITILLISTQVAFASAEGHALPWSNFIYRIITFVGFVGIIAYFLAPKPKPFSKPEQTVLLLKSAPLKTARPKHSET